MLVFRVLLCTLTRSFLAFAFVFINVLQSFLFVSQNHYCCSVCSSENIIFRLFSTTSCSHILLPPCRSHVLALYIRKPRATGRPRTRYHDTMKDTCILNLASSLHHPPLSIAKATQMVTKLHRCTHAIMSRTLSRVCVVCIAQNACSSSMIGCEQKSQRESIRIAHGTYHVRRYAASGLEFRLDASIFRKVFIKETKFLKHLLV